MHTLPGPHRWPYFRRWCLAGLLAAGALASASAQQPAKGAPPVEPLSPMAVLLNKGAYEEVVTQATEELKRNPRDEDLSLILAQAQLEQGRLGEARRVLEQGTRPNPFSLRLRLLAHETARRMGDDRRAQSLLQEMDRMSAQEWRFQTPADRVALGQATLLAKADPRRVLERYLDPVQREQPNLRAVYLAKGELALQKTDYALAAKIFAEAARRFPGETPMLLGLARAYQPSDTQAMMKALEALLKVNPRHPEAHLLLAEQHLDAERLEEANNELYEVLEVDPTRPAAHALRAVIAELKGSPLAAEQAHARALEPWARNPEVEHLIGRKLAGKYRFTEGAAYQRKALEFAPDFLPAKLELAQALLRLGQEEGWHLAQQVQQADPYDVVAYNLVTLQDKLAKFQTLTSPHFLLRMTPEEAAIYGPRAQALLERAYAQLSAKYGLQLPEPTIVEVFPDQRDFAIRTFGLPGGQGYLGVCFGRVITMNSPASRPDWASNWEAVLWHEFTHVVTLNLTRNKMPRWLSEGISVYEERQARGTWGEQMKPRYRAMILNEDFTPLSKLSGAFLRPKTPAHLQFAYYESSLAVEFLLERLGLEALKRTFTELAQGRPLNEALGAQGIPLAKLDEEFATRAQALARGVAPELDWATPDPKQVVGEAALEQWFTQHPNSYTTLLETAKKALKARQWEAAKAPLQRLIQAYPEQREASSAYALLARVYFELKDPAAEYAQWQEVAKRTSEAPEAYTRLMELAEAKQDWPAVLEWAEAYTAVNPLAPVLYRRVAKAREALGQKPEAIAAFDTNFKLDPAPPLDLRYRQAKLLQETGQSAEAQQRLLAVLEEAPRYRAALKLLLELQPAKPQ